jgi:deoxycytidine triphosphate deaminase
VIVSDQTLKKLLSEGAIVIEPLEDYQIQPWPWRWWLPDRRP